MARPLENSLVVLELAPEHSFSEGHFVFCTSSEAPNVRALRGLVNATIETYTLVKLGNLEYKNIGFVACKRESGTTLTLSEIIAPFVTLRSPELALQPIDSLAVFEDLELVALAVFTSVARVCGVPRIPMHKIKVARFTFARTRRLAPTLRRKVVPEPQALESDVGSPRAARTPRSE